MTVDPHSLLGQHDALSGGAGVAQLRREVVVAKGPDVISYLQGQLSQDISDLAVGAGTVSFVLQPHGKVDALVFVARTDEETVVLQVDRGFRPSLVDRLERFKLRTKVDFTTPNWQVLAVRGPEASSVQITAGMSLSAQWRGALGFDVVGENPQVEGAVPVDSDVMDAYRIELGIPQMGRELDEKTIPAEAAINDMAISFTKGCYTGQELVARIDSRGGNVPRLLRGLIMDGEEAPPGGAQVLPSGPGALKNKPLGLVTSAAFSPRRNAVVALAYIRREGNSATEGVVDWDFGPTPCRIVDLPMVP